jgi:hypothetical protein
VAAGPALLRLRLSPPFLPSLSSTSLSRALSRSLRQIHSLPLRLPFSLPLQLSRTHTVSIAGSPTAAASSFVSSLVSSLVLSRLCLESRAAFGPESRAAHSRGSQLRPALDSGLGSGLGLDSDESRDQSRISLATASLHEHTTCSRLAILASKMVRGPERTRRTRTRVRYSVLESIPSPRLPVRCHGQCDAAGPCEASAEATRQGYDRLRLAEYKGDRDACSTRRAASRARKMNKSPCSSHDRLNGAHQAM